MGHPVINVLDTTDRLPEQAQVREEPDERHRPARHPPLLRQHRPRQLDGRGTAHRGPENRPVLQNHANSQVCMATEISHKLTHQC